MSTPCRIAHFSRKSLPCAIATLLENRQFVIYQHRLRTGRDALIIFVPYTDRLHGPTTSRRDAFKELPVLHGSAR